MAYRRDIDGLRALAIVPVVLYHARIPGWSGGFIGVDVFFVISGYLITGLLVGDLQADRYSIANFYERRIRRILPALYGVLLVTSMVVWLLFLPDDAAAYGRSLVATLTFCSNMLFATESGYFDSPAETKPLLHTWSLSVEEQFYVLFPLFLFLVHRYFQRRYAVSIGIVLGASFLLATWAVHAFPVSAFYQSPPRAWELLVGALLATGAMPPLRDSATAALLAALGMAGIAYGVFGFGPETPFPGPNALFPVVGTALLLYAGATAGNPVARFLGLRAPVFIGLISYSWYLWHWVLLVLARYYAIRPLTHSEAFLVAGASVIPAGLSWRYVESPFRGRKWIGSRAWVFSRAATASLLLAGVGVLAWTGHDNRSRFGPDVQRLLAGREDLWSRRGVCTGMLCHVGADSSSGAFLLWGDSHAGALAPAIERLAADKGLAGVVAYEIACAPLVHLRRYDRTRNICAPFADSVLSYVAAHHIGTVFLHARWALYAEGTRYHLEEGEPVLITASRDHHENLAVFDTLLRETLADLRRLNVRIILVAGVPEVGIDVPEALARIRRSGSHLAVAPSVTDFAQRQARALDVLRRAARDYDATVLEPASMLCGPTRCPVVEDGSPLYSDDNHLSVTGAMKLRPLFEPFLQPPLGVR